jgi:WD40 repeat protein
VNFVTYAKDGESLFLGTFSGSVVVWDLLNNSVVEILKGYSPGVTIALSDNEKYLATGGQSMIARLTDLETKAIAFELDSHTTVNSMDFSSSGRYLALAETNGIDIWDIEKGKLIKEFDFGDGFSVNFSPDESELYVVVACRSCKANIKAINMINLKATEFNTAKPAMKIVLSPDGKFLVSGDQYGDILVLDTKSRTVFKSIGNIGGSISSLTISNDGSYLAAASWSGSLYVWNLKKQR